MFGLARTDAAGASLLLNLEGLATMGIAWGVFRESVDGRLLVGAFSILAGAGVLSWQGHASFQCGQGATARLLLLYTARPEFRAQWPPRAHYTQVTLSRLSARNIRTMVEEVAARKAMSDETIATVIERTGGVPLFVEELTRALLESGHAQLTGRAIPVTLHDSLMARLDRLGPAKEIIQIGAVIGGEFSYELLHAVHPIAEENLQHALRNLADAELIYVRGIAPDATYQFKHALIRDAAYEALLKSRRKELHRLVASTIEEQFPDLKETHPEVLARHWTEAGEIEPAVTEWTRAGKAAEASHAFVEVRESFQQALALLNLLPESQERDARELELMQSLYQALSLTRGFAAPETLAAFELIGVLAEKSGDLLKLAELRVARANHSCWAGDFSEAGILAEEAFQLALRDGNPTMMATVHLTQLMVRHSRGDLAGVEHYFVSGRKFFDDPVFRHSPTARAISVFAWAGFNAWILGRADLARERLSKSRAAVNPANPYDLAWADVVAAILHSSMREYETVETLAVRALDICEKNHLPTAGNTARLLLGHARAELGHVAENISLIRGGIDSRIELGGRIGIPGQMTHLAAAQYRAGAVADALETVEQALNFNPEEIVGRPETLRIRGELRLKQGHVEMAEADFLESIAMARSMGAKAWELRTTMSLARLLRATNRRDQACTMLAEIHNWFTEGFDTPDLKDAKALLQELGA